MNHHITVLSHVLANGLRLWYARCTCQWQPQMREGALYFGRDTWEAAMDAAESHLNYVKD